MKHITLKDGSLVVIREANKTDARNMLEYVNKISKESDNLTFGEGEFGISLEQEEQFIESTSKQNNTLFIIAELDGEVIGNLNFLCGKRPRIEHTGEFGVSILKEYWGEGLGTQLIRYLIDWSKNSGIIRKINLRVRTDNEAAINLYKKMGFNIEGTITRELKINNRFYDTLFMGLTID